MQIDFLKLYLSGDGFLTGSFWLFQVQTRGDTDSNDAEELDGSEEF